MRQIVILATFYLLSANVFDLVKSKILLFGKELNDDDGDDDDGGGVDDDGKII